MTTTSFSSSSSDDSTVTINLSTLQSYLERHNILDKRKNSSIFGAYWSSLRGTAEDDTEKEEEEEEEEDGRKNNDDAGHGGVKSLGPRVKALQRVIVETISEQQRDAAAVENDDEFVAKEEGEDEDMEEEDKTLKKRVLETIDTFLIETLTAKGMEMYLHSFVAEEDGGGSGGGGGGDKNILQSLTYFDIRTLLHQMEHITNIDKSKTLFGKYKSSTYLSKWETILQQYQQNNVHITHSIRLLILGYQYEIPALKENIVTKHKKLVSVETRIQELESKYNDVCIKFDTMCTTLGIDGIEDMDVSVERVVRNELPDFCETIENELMQEVGLREAMEYYEQFVRFVTLSTSRKKKLKKMDSFTKEKKEEEEDERHILVVKTLKQFLLSGSSSSSSSTNVDAAAKTGSDEGSSSDAAAVPMLSTEEEDAINTEPTKPTSGKEVKGDYDDGTNEIDWGLVDDNGDDDDTNKNDNDDKGMDWDIEITDAGKVVVDDDNNCGGDQGVVVGVNNVIHEQQQQKPTTTTTFSFSLASKSVRYDLLSDLTELKSFLQIRLLEQLNGSGIFGGGGGGPDGGRKKKKRITSSGGGKSSPSVSVGASSTATTTALLSKSDTSSSNNDKGSVGGSTMPIKTEYELESYIQTIQSILNRLTTGKFHTLTLLSDTNIQYRNKIISNLNMTLDTVTKTQSKIDDMIQKKTNLLQQINELKETLNLYECRVDMLKFDLEVEIRDLLLLKSGSGKKKPAVVRIVV